MYPIQSAGADPLPITQVTHKIRPSHSFKIHLLVSLFETDLLSQVLKNHQWLRILSYAPHLIFNSSLYMYDLSCSKQSTPRESSGRGGEDTPESPRCSASTPAFPCCSDLKPANQQLVSICPKYSAGQEKQAKICDRYLCC